MSVVTFFQNGMVVYTEKKLITGVEVKAVVSMPGKNDTIMCKSFIVYSYGSIIADSETTAYEALFK